jgi:phage head maturation protease
MPPIASHNTAVVDTPWDGSVAVAAIPNDAGEDVLRHEYAWADPSGDPTTKAAYKFPHHNIVNGRPGPANMAGLRNAMSRIPQADIPAGDDAGVRAHIQHHMDAMAGRAARPPRDMLVRSQGGDFEVREAEGQSPTLVGHFGVFNQWAEIRSAYEGRFMERMLPGAFARTLKNNRDQIKVTFNHGKDPGLGDRVLGLPSVLEEDREGGRYEVPLFDGIPPLILDGLRKNAYGSSLRMRVVQDDWTEKPKKSATNPEGIPERSIAEVQLYEFGPVTYPAYRGATAAVRSTTDEYLISLIRSATDALPDAGSEAEPHSDEGTREEPPAPPATPTPPRSAPPVRRFRSDAEWLAYLQKEHR